MEIHLFLGFYCVFRVFNLNDSSLFIFEKDVLHVELFELVLQKSFVYERPYVSDDELATAQIFRIFLYFNH